MLWSWRLIDCHVTGGSEVLYTRFCDGTSVRNVVTSTHGVLVRMIGTIPPQNWMNATEVGEVGRPTAWIPSCGHAW